MHQDEVASLIKSQINVTRQHVVIAKAYILKHFEASTQNMLNKFKLDMEAGQPEKVVLHPSVPLKPQIDQAVKAIIWQLAFGEAVWGLINANVIIPMGYDMVTIQAEQQWTTVVPGGGGLSAGWHFEEHYMPVPLNMRIAPTIVNDLPQPLSDPDLYLADLEIPDLHTEIEESLKQAALCFRYELNIPCLAMLAKASEGAWIEMGLSLLKTVPGNTGLNIKQQEKIRETLNSEYTSVVQKMDTILQLFERQDIFGEVAKKCGFNQRYLRQVLNWSNVVRDSRNAVHYGADPATQNTYEKVAALLLGAVPNLRILYGIRQAAEEIANTPSA